MKTKILIADDEADIVSMLRSFFESKGCLVLSAVCKGQMTALIASAAAYLFPVVLPIAESSPLFRPVALLPLYHIQFISLMSVEQFGGSALYALLAVPVAIILLVFGASASREAFAKHQVR